jgi:1-acyl-sn-glycerol-3-phosphate acyltransferase
MATVRSLIFMTITIISIVIFSVLIILARPFGSAASYRTCRSWSAMTLVLCKVLCGLDFTVEGKENLPQTNSVVFLKHSSAYETITQWVIFPRQTWVMKRELLWPPFLGWALALLQPIAINRSAGRAAVDQVIAQGSDRLNSGLWVMIFPEGTRMGPGETRRYGVSGTLLAQNAQRLIVPVAHNAGDFWPRRAFKKRPGTVKFCIGPPVDPAGRDPREVNAELQQWIETKVAEL